MRDGRIEVRTPKHRPFRHPMYWSFDRNWRGENKKTSSPHLPVVACLAPPAFPSRNSKLVPHFAFGCLRPLSHSPLEVKSRRGNVAQEVRPPRTKLRQLTLAHINH